jgi:hypothetical protein
MLVGAMLFAPHSVSQTATSAQTVPAKAPVLQDTPEARRAEAIKAATEIWLARVIDASPVGHGTEDVHVSYKLRPSSLFKTGSEDVWVDFSLRRGAPSHASLYEVSLRKGQEWIFFLKKKKDANNIPGWDLLRVEHIEKKQEVLDALEAAGAGP